MNELISLVKDVAPGVATLLGGPIAGGVVSFLGDHILGNASASVSDIVTAVKDPDTYEKLKECETQLAITKIQANVQLQTAQLANANVQGEVNVALAKTGSFFYNGPHAALLWVGTLAFLNNYVLLPYLHAIFPQIISLDLTAMMPVMMGLLGLGGMHVYANAKKNQSDDN